MRLTIAVTVAVVLGLLAPEAMAAGKKAKKAAQPCLNALACGPQPVPKVRKPKTEKFMKSAS